MRTVLWAVSAALALAGSAANAAAQNQQLSEQAVKKYMDYAWSLTPQKFTTPDNKTIEIDRKNRDAVMVPIDVAREIIMTARMTAHAQICELPDAQVDNYRSLMLREEAKKKWSEQQMVYINQLHLTVVMLLNGKIKLLEQQGDKQVPIEEKETPVRKMTDEECKAVRAKIAEYVQSGPALTKADAGGATPAATPTKN